jgi:hypothetical protein
LILPSYGAMEKWNLAILYAYWEILPKRVQMPMSIYLHKQKLLWDMRQLRVLAS